MSLRAETLPPFLVVVLLLCIRAYGDDTDSMINPTVNTTLGLIRGVRAEDGDYYMFMGIPFAQVNMSNPFGKATPQEPFDDIFDATDDSAICPQREEFNQTLVGNLDCLHLNIYTPTTASPANLKAVMVLIYGGGYYIGFAGRYLYGPKFFLRYDVLLVTLNYRLGPYGFMCLGTPEVPGNEGFKDQLLALRWINQNIEAFGGDPNKITIFGNSAGGMAADFHILSSYEKLFNQAIFQSGTALSTRYSPPVRDAPLILANHFGYSTNNLNEAITYLATVNTSLIIEAASNLNLSFRPCIEDQFEGVESFITEDWMQSPMPKIRDMPIIIGITNHERLAFINNAANVNNSVVITNLNNDFKANDPSFEGMDKLVRQFYMGDEDIDVEKVMAVIDYLSDISFNHAGHRSVSRYLENNAGNIYFYMLSYVGGRNFVRNKDNLPDGIGGAAHADELGYLFDISYYDTPTAEDQLIIDRMTKLWTNFAKFGNPTPETSDLLPLEWQPITNESAFHFLELDLELKSCTRPMSFRMAFLDLFYEVNGHLLRLEHPND